MCIRRVNDLLLCNISLVTLVCAFGVSLVGFDSLSEPEGVGFGVSQVAVMFQACSRAPDEGRTSSASSYNLFGLGLSHTGPSAMPLVRSR